MTIMEAITRLDRLKHNTFTQEEKIHWLSQVESQIVREMINTHRGGEAMVFSGYHGDTPLDTLLLAPPPYDELYLYWMLAQMDYFNGEFGWFNNDIALFTQSYRAFAHFYNSTHEPIGCQIQYF